MMEKTLCMIKPDAVSNGDIGSILAMIEGSGLKVVALKLIQLNSEQASLFYQVHQQRPFFASLVEFISSGPLVAAVLSSPDAISKYRQLMGATNPSEAAPETIRAKYATSIDNNAVHGSDSPEAAKIEIDFFFPELT